MYIPCRAVPCLCHAMARYTRHTRVTVFHLVTTSKQAVAGNISHAHTIRGMIFMHGNEKFNSYILSSSTCIERNVNGPGNATLQQQKVTQWSNAKERKAASQPTEPASSQPVWASNCICVCVCLVYLCIYIYICLCVVRLPIFNSSLNLYTLKKPPPKKESQPSIAATVRRKAPTKRSNENIHGHYKPSTGCFSTARILCCTPSHVQSMFGIASHNISGNYIMRRITIPSHSTHFRPTTKSDE